MASSNVKLAPEGREAEALSATDLVEGSSVSEALGDFGEAAPDRSISKILTAGTGTAIWKLDAGALRPYELLEL